MKNIIDIIKSCDNLHLGTIGETGAPDIRIMKNLQFENLNNLDAIYFFSDKRHPKNHDIKKNGAACVYAFNSDTRMAVRLYGNIIESDAADKFKFWNDAFKRFNFTGPDDENFTILKFMPKSYKYYEGPEEKLQIGDVR